jgi:hypothetical protein
VLDVSHAKTSSGQGPVASLLSQSGRHASSVRHESPADGSEERKDLSLNIFIYIPDFVYTCLSDFLIRHGLFYFTGRNISPNPQPLLEAR